MFRVLSGLRLILLLLFPAWPAQLGAQSVPGEPAPAPSASASATAPEPARVPASLPATAPPEASAGLASPPAVPAGSTAPAKMAPEAVRRVPLTPQDAFNRALTAYRAGALEEARREFLTIVEGGHISAALAHNLGNIEYRRGQPGQAALWYRRSLILQPFSPETLQNLRTIRRQTAFLSFEPWGLSFAHLKPQWIEYGTVTAAWAVGLLVVWLVWLTPAQGRRWPLVALLLLVLPVLTLGAILTWRLKTDPHPFAKRQVVSGKETMAYAAPAEASSSVIGLPAGSEVVPVETRGNWFYCIIPGGEAGQPLRGWVRAAKLEPLWPYQGKSGAL